MDEGQPSPTVAIMQPYFFPYLGYFQLIAAADTFVLYDDVQYIARGWSNRNRILLNGEPHLITLPVEQGHQVDLYNQRRYTADQRQRDKLLATVRAAYSKAPFFADAFPLIEELMAYEELSVAAFNGNLLTRLSAHLGLRTDIVSASRLAIPAEVKGQERILAACEALGARHYVNPPGGVDLYDARTFRERGMELMFLKPSLEPYPQFARGWVPGLSIIDVLMFNPVDKARELVLRGISTEADPDE